MSGELLEVDHVTKSFAIGGLFGRGHFNAVDDVSFALQAESPEILAIIGKSGSGKTTLARMILNAVTPTSGVIRFRGEALHRGARPPATARLHPSDATDSAESVMKRSIR